MRTPAVSIFGAVLLIGCWNDKPIVAPQPSSLDPSSHDPTGLYWCSIDDEERLEFRCEITREGARLRLTKVNGGERIRGELTVEGDELAFAGERFCMWEECTSKLSGRFKSAPGGQYVGTFKEAPLVVRLAPMPAGAVGGQGYGGDANDGVDSGTPFKP
jgi:hypothetical protein